MVSKLTPNNPSASRKEQSQSERSRKTSSRLRYRFKKGRLVSLIKKRWIPSKDLEIMWEVDCNKFTQNAYSSSFLIGAASSCSRTSPASKISLRTEMRMSAHRSVSRKQLNTFIWRVSLMMSGVGKRHETYVDQLWSIPNIEQELRSWPQARYRRQIKEIHANEKSFMGDIFSGTQCRCNGLCDFLKNRRHKQVLKRRMSRD